MTDLTPLQASLLAFLRDRSSPWFGSQSMFVEALANPKVPQRTLFARLRDEMQFLAANGWRLEFVVYKFDRYARLTRIDPCRTDPGSNASPAAGPRSTSSDTSPSAPPSAPPTSAPSAGRRTGRKGSTARPKGAAGGGSKSCGSGPGSTLCGGSGGA